MALMLNALNHSWFLIFPYVGGGIPMNAWLMKGYFDTVPMSLDESAKLDGAGTLPSLLANCSSTCSPNGCRTSSLGLHGTFRGLHPSSFLLREKEYFTVAVGLQTFVNNAKNLKIAYFSAGAILIALPICILFFFLQKNFVSGLTSGGDKDNISPPPFLYCYKIYTNNKQFIPRLEIKHISI